jgi:DNA replicative helicase MCM subunit Mcm2 (Cdc46/Mcm family)
VERLSANGDGFAQLVDVLNEAERLDISREKAEEVIDKLNQNGRLMRPTGYDTLQIV